MYEYSARVVKVIDGDTVDLDVDLGMHVHTRTRVRLFGLDTAEDAAGKEATAFLRATLPIGTEVLLNTLKDKTEKYGRWLGILRRKGMPEPINQTLIELGHARPWDGQGPHPWDTTR